MRAIQVTLVILLQALPCACVFREHRPRESGRAAVQALLDAAFPDVAQSKELIWGSLETADRFFVLRIGAPECPTFHGTVTARGEDDVYVESAVFGGSLLHYDALRELKYTKWVDAPLAMIRDELAALGARFGPDKRDEFLATRLANRYNAVLGRVESTSVEFLWRGEMDEYGRRTLYLPRWRIQLQSVRHGKTMCSVLFFEPFDGRLTYLRQEPCER